MDRIEVKYKSCFITALFFISCLIILIIILTFQIYDDKKNCVITYPQLNNSVVICTTIDGEVSNNDFDTTKDGIVYYLNGTLWGFCYNQDIHNKINEYKYGCDSP